MSDIDELREAFAEQVAHRIVSDPRYDQTKDHTFEELRDGFRWVFKSLEKSHGAYVRWKDGELVLTFRDGKKVVNS